ncbi:cobalt-precorrin-6A reductase [Acaryochloris sp. IP29b_bin.137]|uniref:cobalt-precorrin-6A reductase n=1 Tax=Acaryochloris sp. IP29b_bin.137 TaxID=2969217 RepID=UPI0026345ADB|nr:cobalt-precorrin-6A reductase [Acaryochloris sp. IP29b_bin.137]
MLHQIWLIGGTTESVDLACCLRNSQLPCLVTVVTKSAQGLYPPSPWLQIRTEALADNTIEPFIYNHHIAAILDASHPYATEISRLAMGAAVQFKLPYLRFERSPTCHPSAANQDGPIEISDLSSLFEQDYLLNQRVLLTIGSRALRHFIQWHQHSTLFARVLPQVQAIQAAEKAGFSCDRILALRPPISFDLEKALWEQWQISVVVAKASGQPGGEDIKRQVAQALGVTLIMIKRPSLTYPQQTSDLNTAVQFCQAALNPK